MIFIKYLFGISVPLLLIACSLDVSVEKIPVDQNLRMISNCNITTAKLNAARSRENVFQVYVDGNHEYQVKEGEPTRGENAIQMKTLEADRLVCKKYITENGAGGIPLMDDCKRSMHQELLCT